ncbi:hypothetical protein BKI52_24490 [marine bacterium AO1-C]|nr:hypothetical protein BKI52_24490 [marine bacterium AO1-C]
MIHYLNEEFAAVNYNPQVNLVEVIWRTHQQSSHYRQAINAAYEIILKYGANKWLSDMRNEGVVSVEDQKWLKEEMVPKAFKAGLRRIALVVSKDVFVRFYTKNIQKPLVETFQVRHFDDIEQAHKWLMSKP